MERFGPYKLVRRLATGGMAEIFLARQLGIEGFEREVVIKRILPHRAQDEEFSTMFLDEARLIARLNHPYIAQVYDLGQHEGSYYIAMEYVQGVDLSNLLDSAASEGTPGLPMPVAVAVIASLCQALDYIHTRTDELGHPLNIVHRDLNPKNVIISYEGAVKLIDFGIAKASSQVYETRTGVIKGTYGYMAPEQVSRAHSIDLRADLFALGVLTYELTTGMHPFDAPDEVAVLGKLVRCQYQPPSRKIRNFPKTLERAIVSCMGQEPGARPSSAAEVLSLLEDFANERQIPLTMSRIAEYVRRNHVEQEAKVTQIPPVASEAGDSTAMISQRLGDRVDEELGSQATSLLRAPPQDERGMVRRPSAPPSATSQPSPPASAGRGFEWPWSNWGRRERIVASVASLVALFATLTSIVLVVVLFGTGGEQSSVTSVESLEGETLTSSEGSSGSLVSNPTRSPAPQPPLGAKTIRVESRPPQARILVEGKSTGHLTPATVNLPEGQNLVWIKVELDGYEAGERQIAAAAGEAVFTLSPVEEDGP